MSTHALSYLQTKLSKMRERKEMLVCRVTLQQSTLHTGCSAWQAGSTREDSRKTSMSGGKLTKFCNCVHGMDKPTNSTDSTGNSFWLTESQPREYGMLYHRTLGYPRAKLCLLVAIQLMLNISLLLLISLTLYFMN